MRHTIDASKNSCSHVLKQESLNDQEDTPDNLQKGIHSSKTVFADWKKGSTNEEIDIQKQILTGSQVVHWDNPAAISANIHSVLLQDKSLETIDGFKDKVESVSYDAVREAMNQLHVDCFKRVVAGTIL